MPRRSWRQGLTLVHFSAQREHFFSRVVECFAGFSDKNGSGLAKMWTSVSPWLEGAEQMAERGQGLTLIHFSAQRKRYSWDSKCVWGVVTGCLRVFIGGAHGVLLCQKWLRLS